MKTSDMYSGEEREGETLEEKIEQKIEERRGSTLNTPPRYKKSSNFLDYALPFSYQERWEQARKDILKFITSTTMNKFPVQGNEGLYGWTIRGTNKVNIRDDLHSLQKLETDIHECTHTPDEYETRRRTEWKLQALLPEERKYGGKLREYIL